MRTADSFLANCNALMHGQSPRDILRKALELLEDPDRWTPWERAMDAQGRPVRPESPEAVCWSVESAIAKVCGSFGIVPPYFMVLLDSVLTDDLGFSMGIAYFEQHYSHEMVLGLLRKAIEKAPAL